MKAYESRREARDRIFGEVLWSYAHSETREKFQGGVFDTSSRGISIFTHLPLMDGDILRISMRSTRPDERYASVVWCSRVSQGVYRCGLLFTGEDSAWDPLSLITLN